MIDREKIFFLLNNGGFGSLKEVENFVENCPSESDWFIKRIQKEIGYGRVPRINKNSKNVIHNSVKKV